MVEQANARADFVEAVASLPDPKPYAIRARKEQRGKHFQAATYVMLASDWHIEERVRPETVGWRNEYSPEIAQERAERFFKSENDTEERERLANYRRGTQAANAALNKAEGMLAVGSAP